MTLTTKGYEQLAALLDVEADPADVPFYKPRYNVAPTDDHWIVWKVADKKKLRRAKWGFRPGGRELLINVRAETARKRFKSMLEARRCLVPADGFYEWKGPREDRRPIWFHPSQGELFLFAGLYEEPRDGPPTFTVLTTAANETVAPIHDRMPLILTPERARAWLEGAPEEPPPTPAASVLVGTEVSKRCNSVANDDPSCLAPPAPEKPGSDQMSLF
jgi:putative SOS response-associated peptidase YedK